MKRAVDEQGQNQAHSEAQEALQSAVVAARRGERAALRQIVEQTQGSVFRLMMRMVGRREDAEDLTQQSYIEAFASLDRLDERYGFRSYLLRIAVNNAKDFLKSHKRRELPTALENQQGQALFAARSESPQQLLERRQLGERLEAALALLDPLYRLPVLLKDVEGLSYQEMQQILPLPLTTLKIRVVRGRAQLQRQLMDEVV